MLQRSMSQVDVIRNLIGNQAFLPLLRETQAGLSIAMPSPASRSMARI